MNVSKVTAISFIWLAIGTALAITLFNGTTLAI